MIKTCNLAWIESSWHIDYRNHDGKRIKFSVGKDKRVAVMAQAKCNEWILVGKDPREEFKKELAERKIKPAKPLTLKEFYPVFVEKHASLKSKNVQLLWEGRMAALDKHGYSDIALTAITKANMREYMATRMAKDKVKAATANREMAMVKNMLFRAVDWGVINSNPIAGLKPLAEAKKRKVILTRNDAARLVETLPRHVGYVVEFAIYTGFRKESILSLRIEQINFEQKFVVLDESNSLKGGGSEIFPLSDAALAVVRECMGRRKEGYVFLTRLGGRHKSILRTFHRAVDKLRLKVNGGRLRFHDLRHVFATWLYDATGNLGDIQRLLNHEDQDTTEEYVDTSIRNIAHVPNYIKRLSVRRDRQTKDSAENQEDTEEADREEGGGGGA